MKQKIKSLLQKNKTLFSFTRNMHLFFKIKRNKQIKGKQNIIKNDGIFTNVKLDIEGDNNTIEIKNGTRLSNLTIYIRGNDHHLLIDENCIYKKGSICFEDTNCEIRIGKNTSVESAHLAVTEPDRKIIIGEDCMLADDVVFRTGDSHSIIDLEKKERINYAENIEIGNHVWVGANATLLKGVKVGDNSIIGTGALVTTSIPANSLAAGIPAKVLKNNVDWLRERIYKQL